MSNRYVCFSAVLATFILPILVRGEGGGLRISEICPCDTALISNRYETGWVELYNSSETAVDLANYELARFNRGKAMKPGAATKNLPSKIVPAKSRVVIYCNEEFGDDLAEYEFGLYFPDKINPKKYPLVCLYEGTSTKTLVDKVVVPVDCPDGSSIVCEDAVEPAGGTGGGGESGGDAPVPVAATPVSWTADNLTLDPSVTTQNGVEDASGAQRDAWDLTANASCNSGLSLDASIAAQLVAADDYSIDFWFLIPTNTGTGENTGKGMPLFESRPSKTSPYNGVIVYVDPMGELVVQPRTAAKTVPQTCVGDSDVRYDDGKWHHLVFQASQLETGMLRVVVDGQELWYAKMPGLTPLQADRPLYFGRSGDSTSWFAFQGYLADIKLYSGDVFATAASTASTSQTATAASTAGRTSDELRIAYADLKAGVTRRFLTKKATKGAANDVSDAVALGPQVSSLYGVANAVDPWAAYPQARPGEDYAVTLPVNPVDAANTNDAIVRVTLLYRADYGTIQEVDMVPGTVDPLDGQRYTASIPAADLPAPGHLIRWAARIEDAAGNVWRAPSFNDPDGAYEWYGTLVEPASGQESATLQTFHLFGDAQTADTAGNGSTTFLMNRQYDAISGSYPYGARIGIYDSMTGLYYDNVKIDLRGNSTATLKKKSHSLKFNKSQPLSCTDPVTGTVVKEVRRTSWIAEYVDPSYVRQSLSFKAFRDMGNRTPFHYPVRLNINGAFYELAGHSNRFTDELIEDYYEMDPWGYAFKSVGQLNTSLSTTGGGIEKKTPDDDNESDLTQLRAFVNTFAGTLASVSDATDFAASPTYSAAVTKTVVEKFDLPAWINYLALARVTQECDDVWANLCIYYDVNGTDTWMPLAYDLNLSWGAIYNGDVGGHPGAKADDDAFKSHPFYGGMHIRAGNNGNCGFEAVYQSEKFRRLFLRRLRSAMDAVLQVPGTNKADSPYWQYCELLATNMLAEATLDREKWGCPTGAKMYTWPTALTPQQGLEDLWENYIVKRRVHLYETHSVTNTEKGIGYGKSLSAGIPAAQSALADLKAGLSAEAVPGGVVLRNANAETIDLSGWEVSGPVNMTLPAGTVIDQMLNGKTGEVFVVTDRRSYVAEHLATLTDEVIVGNATVGSGDTVGLQSAEGTVILAADKVFEPGSTIAGEYDIPVRLAGSGAYTLQGARFNQGLFLPEGTYTLKNQNPSTNTASVVTAPAADVTFTGKGTFALQGEKTSGTLMEVNDLLVSNGVFIVESKAQTSNTCAVVVNGNFAVEDKGMVSMKLTKNARTGRGIFMASKNKFCRIGNGGTFTAELNGPGCRAIQGDKGSVDLEIKNGATVSGVAAGEDIRFFKMKGNIKVSGGAVNLTGSGANTELLSCDKAVEISGGILHLEATDDCVSAAAAITVSGGELVGVSTANDVLDSNGTITITGGTLVLLSTAKGHEGLDCDPGEPDGAVHTLTLTGGIVCSLGGADCDLHLPEAGGQAYAVLDTAAEAGCIAAPAGVLTHYFAKPAGGRTVLVSVPGLSGPLTEVAAFPADATEVIAAYYQTQVKPCIAPGAVVELQASDAAAAAAEVAGYVIELSAEDQAAELSVEDLVVVAEAVTDDAGTVTGYRAVVAVAPSVPSPQIGGDAQGTVAPLSVMSADANGRTVSIGVDNAVKGLWYGYEVADDLSAGFIIDGDSFVRARGPVVEITGRKRTAPSGFFRVKVLPAKPTR